MLCSMTHTECAGQTIAAWRREAGLSQSALAALAGINRTTLAKFELGITRTSSDTLIALCAALRRPVGELLQEDSRKSLVSAIIGA